MKLTQFLTILSLIYKWSQSASPFDFTLSCTSPNYINRLLYDCSECGANQETFNDALGCKCQDGFFNTNESVEPFDCEACPSGEASTYSRTECIPCTDCPCDEGGHKVEYQPDGQKQTTMPCQTCDLSARPAVVNEIYGRKCFPCAIGKERQDQNTNICSCTGEEIGGVCISEEDLNEIRNEFPELASESRNSLTYENLIDSSSSGSFSVTSSIFSCNLEKVIYIYNFYSRVFYVTNIKISQVATLLRIYVF